MAIMCTMTVKNLKNITLIQKLIAVFFNILKDVMFL